MQALQIEQPGRAVWRAFDAPTLDAGEVLVAVRGVTTCPHWDLHVFDGEPMFPGHPHAYPHPPGLPGHELTGEVVEVGPGAAGFAVGDRVAAWRDPGGRRWGGYAEAVPVRAEHLIAVDPALPAAAVAPLELAMCVQASFDQLRQRASIEGARFAVAGLGPAGLVAVQMARAYGAREVVGIDPLPERRALAERLGADGTFAPGADPLPTARSAPDAFDAALDTTGLPVSIEALLAGTRRTVAIFGVLREPVRFGPAQWWGDCALLGYATHTRGAAERAYALVEAGRLDLAALVTHELPLSRYAEGVELLRRKEAVKVLFRP